MININIKLLFRRDNDEKSETFLGIFKSDDLIPKAIENDKIVIKEELKLLYKHFDVELDNSALKAYEWVVKNYPLEEIP